MRRREFIAGLGGAATMPLIARAQQTDRMRRIGVLTGDAADDPEARANVAALHLGLQDAGWVVGRNLHIEMRWSAGDMARMRQDAEELIRLGSEVIVAGPGPTSLILQQMTRTVPIVFAQAVDPVGGGFVQSLARPGGNLTGFIQFEYGLSAKWFELLREISPQTSRVGVIRELRGPVGIGQWAVIQTFASLAGVEVNPINLTAAVEIERSVSDFARDPNGGLILVVGLFGSVHREQIVKLSAKYRLPTVYPYRSFVANGGLVSYGADLISQYRRAASYVDRILKGEKPSDLPVQAPTKYVLAINLKTAKAMGLTIPATVLTRADEVIE
jgi:putative tryptophan/tyrosine transport system substrate-binding protein